MNLLKEKLPAVAGVVLATAALAVAFHGTLAPSPDASSAPGSAMTAAAPTPRTVAVKERNGRSRNLAQPTGHILVVHFWATWCAPCVEEFPGLLAAWQKLRNRKDIEFAFVSVDDSWKVVDPWLAARRGMAAPMYLDISRSAATTFGTEKFPETWILGPDGAVLDHIAGPMDWTNPGAVQHLDELAAALPKKA